jgi:hypothetical protein
MPVPAVEARTEVEQRRAQAAQKRQARRLEARQQKQKDS